MKVATGECLAPDCNVCSINYTRRREGVNKHKWDCNFFDSPGGIKALVYPWVLAAGAPPDIPPSALLGLGAGQGRDGATRRCGAGAAAPFDPCRGRPSSAGALPDPGGSPGQTMQCPAREAPARVPRGAAPQSCRRAGAGLRSPAGRPGGSLPPPEPSPPPGAPRASPARRDTGN